MSPAKALRRKVLRENFPKRGKIILDGASEPLYEI